MKLKSDSKTGLMSYIIAFGFLLVIAIDISKSMNESKTPPVQTIAPLVVQVAQPQYKEMDFPHSEIQPNRRFFIVEMKQEGSFYHVLYGWENLKAGNTKGYLGLDIVCANNTMRHAGYGGDTPEKARPNESTYPQEWKDVFGMYNEKQSSFSSDEQDIFKFVCGLK